MTDIEIWKASEARSWAEAVRGAARKLRKREAALEELTARYDGLKATSYDKAGSGDPGDDAMVAMIAELDAMREKVKPYGIHITCWFPLGGAMSNGALLKDPTIMQIAEAHGKTPAQVILRWHMQEGFSAIPGASNPDYIEENIAIFDFELTDGEMEQMRALDKEQRFFNATYEQVEQMGKMPMRD